MAIGDKAAAKGLNTVPATQALNIGYQAINQVADYIADEIDARAKSDLDAATLEGKRVRVTSTPMTSTNASTGDIRFW